MKNEIKVRTLELNSPVDAERIMMYLGVDNGGIEAMTPKTKSLNILIDGVKPPAANILKQEMLSLGGECANARDVIMGKPPRSSVLLIGNLKQLERLVYKLHLQPYWGLDIIANRIEDNIKTESKPVLNWKVRDRNISLKERPLIMGVLNVTPDSFYDGGEYIDPEVAVERASEMLEEGADIIDIGGVSTRPGSTPPSIEEELERVIPVMEIVSELDVLISVDTYRSEVARKAVEAGAHIVNDISALRFDEEMVDVIRETGCGLVLMHMKGTPKDMQKSPEYDDVLWEVFQFLEQRVVFAVESGIERDSIAIDVGIGFGKRLQDNLTLMGSLNSFKAIGMPILVGSSRKSHIEHLLGLPQEERLIPSITSSLYSSIRGASILRVHDVVETVRAIDMYKAMEEAPIENICERNE